MKKFVILFVLFSAQHLMGQILSGEITFEVKRDLHRQIPEEMSAMKSRIPEFATSNHTLVFNQQASSYSMIKMPEVDRTPGGQGGNWMVTRMSRMADYEIYTDIETGMSIESREFLGKTFLIDGETTRRKWKLTGESMMVGDYFCQKARYKDDDEDVFVWFTPMIPVSSGPENYNGLPGLILYVDINDEERTITATQIISRPIEKGELKKPTKGEKITQEKFEKMREEKMKEMQLEGRGQGMRFMMRGE